jgi:hypothetical protein
LALAPKEQQRYSFYREHQRRQLHRHGIQWRRLLVASIGGNTISRRHLAPGRDADSLDNFFRCINVHLQILKPPVSDGNTSPRITDRHRRRYHRLSIGYASQPRHRRTQRR